MLRQEVAGYSDEATEDVTFRRLMTPESASRDIHGPTPLDVALVNGVSFFGGGQGGVGAWGTGGRVERGGKLRTGKETEIDLNPEP